MAGPRGETETHAMGGTQYKAKAAEVTTPQYRTRRAAASAATSAGAAQDGTWERGGPRGPKSNQHGARR